MPPPPQTNSPRDNIIQDVTVPVVFDARVSGLANEMLPLIDHLNELTEMSEVSSNALAQMVNRVQALIGTAREAGAPQKELLEIYRQLTAVSKERTESVMRETEAWDGLVDVQKRLNTIQKEREIQEGASVLSSSFIEKNMPEARNLRRGTGGFDEDIQERIRSSSVLFEQGYHGESLVGIRRLIEEIEEGEQELEGHQLEKLEQMKGFFGTMHEEIQQINQVSQEITTNIAAGNMSMQDMVVAAAKGQIDTGQLISGATPQVAEAAEERLINALPPSMRGAAREAKKLRLATAGTRLGTAIGVGSGVAIAGGLAYKGIQAAEVGSREKTGMAGRVTAGESVGLDVEARMMALSPFLTSEQANRIMEGTLEEGYQGERLADAMGFATSNFKDFNMDVKESMDIYRTNVLMAGEDTLQVAGALNNLSEVARVADISVTALNQNFRNVTETAAGLGAGGATTDIGVDISTALAGDPTLGEIDLSPVLQSQRGQVDLAMRMGEALGRPVGVFDIPEAMRDLEEQGRGGEIGGMALGGFADSLMNYANITRDTPWDQYLEGRRPQLIKTLLEQAYGISVSHTEAARIAWQIIHGETAPGATPGEGPEGAQTQQEMREEVAERYEPEDVGWFSGASWGGAARAVNARANWLTNKLVGGFTWGSWDDTFDTTSNSMDIAYYGGVVSDGGQRLPLVEELIDSDRDLRNVAVRDPDTGESVSIIDYVREHGEKGFENLQSGAVDVANVGGFGGEDEVASPEWGSLAAMTNPMAAAAQESAGPERMQIDVTEDARKLINLMPLARENGLHNAIVRENANLGVNEENEQR